MSTHQELRHLGIIMDGNRTWAKKNGVSVADGHKAGFASLKKLLGTIKDQKIEYLSIYAFSTENWKRTEEEVQGLMRLAVWVLQNEIDELHKEGIRVRFLGSRGKLDKKLVSLIESAEKKTASNTEGTLCICFNYGGKQEIVDAANTVIKSGSVLDEDALSQHVYAPDVPDLDLIIRTSGEKRISNFMMWRGSYAEIEFTNTLWPDFSGEELEEIIANYHERNRRFGV